MSVDPRAATGFGSRAQAYERGRPLYPPDAIDRLARELRLTRESTVLDLAAGTGKLTRQLLPLAGHVIAVEPSPAMRDELRRQVVAAEVREGTAESIPLADGSVDAVFVGQAFHWFSPVEAFAEAARVLRPGGGLAMLWNRERWQGPWVERFRALVDPPRKAAGEFPSEGRELFEQSPQFAPWQQAHFTHVHRIGLEEFLALVSSWSWIANLPDGERAGLLAEVRALVEGQTALVEGQTALVEGQTALADGQTALELPYATDVYWSWRT